MVLAERLRGRRPEIENAIMTRVHGISDPEEAIDPEYVEGLRRAVSAALDYGLAAIELGEKRSPQIPEILLVQARLAARVGVSLDTVLRRYFGGFTLLGNFVLQETESHLSLSSIALHRMLKAQAIQFDHLIEVISATFSRAQEERSGSPDLRRAERVRKLLSGELMDTSEFGYPFDGYHVGMIAMGPEASTTARCLAGAFDCRALFVQGGAETVWVWLGGRKLLDSAEIHSAAVRNGAAQVSVAVGECGKGLVGWRLTHQQAAATLPIVLRRSEACVRYADVILLASMFRDELLAESLRHLYLAPLAAERDGGVALRETLRAYFAVEGNVSSAAAALGVSRRTVSNRIQTVEDRLGRPLRSCAAELDTALQLESLNHDAWPTQ